MPPACEWVLAPGPAALAALDARAFATPWPAPDFARLLANPAVGAWMLRRNGDEAAYLCFQVSGGEAEIYRIAVAPEHRRAGLARKLLEHFAGWAAGQGAGRVFLEVRRGNHAAIELYRAAGFDTMARRVDYYTAPREDALVMQRGLKG